MNIQLVSPLGGGFVAALGANVEAGAVVDVPPEVAAVLLIQRRNWALPDDAPEEDTEFAEQAISDHLAALAAASTPESE